MCERGITISLAYGTSPSAQSGSNPVSSFPLVHALSRTACDPFKALHIGLLVRRDTLAVSSRSLRIIATPMHFHRPVLGDPPARNVMAALLRRVSHPSRPLARAPCPPLLPLHPPSPRQLHLERAPARPTPVWCWPMPTARSTVVAASASVLVVVLVPSDPHTCGGTSSAAVPPSANRPLCSVAPPLPFPMRLPFSLQYRHRAPIPPGPATDSRRCLPRARCLPSPPTTRRLHRPPTCVCPRSHIRDTSPRPCPPAPSRTAHTSAAPAANRSAAATSAMDGCSHDTPHTHTTRH